MSDKSPSKIQKQQSIVSFSKNEVQEEEDEILLDSDFSQDLNLKKKRSSRTPRKLEPKKEKSSKEKGVIKIITILFMSHRIQAKIYDSDTFQTFLSRLRMILPNIDSTKTIGLYHLYFIKHDSDEDELCQFNEEGSIVDQIKVPLQEKNLVKEFTECKEGQNYLLLYVDSIFENKSIPSFAHQKPLKEQKSKKSTLYHDSIPLGKTYYKVLRGQSTANKILFCTFSYCMKLFNETGNLKTHMRTHTGDRPFQCDFEGCGKSFITKGHLQTHTLIHTGEKPFTCDQCGKAYSRSGRLKIHQRTHTGEKPFKCKVCSKSFTENGNLKTHMRIHTGEKPFRCEFKGCGRSFTTQGHLTDHKKKHSNIKQFSCDICGTNFLRQNTLNMHLKRHCQEQIECEECQKFFSDQESFEKHMAKSHPKKKVKQLMKLDLKKVNEEDSVSESLQDSFNSKVGQKRTFEQMEAQQVQEEVKKPEQSEKQSQQKLSINLKQVENSALQPLVKITSREPQSRASCNIFQPFDLNAQNNSIKMLMKKDTNKPLNQIMIPNFKLQNIGQQTPANHIIAQSPWGNSAGNYSYKMQQSNYGQDRLFGQSPALHKIPVRHSLATSNNFGQMTNMSKDLTQYLVNGKSPKFIGALGNLTTKNMNNHTSLAFTDAAEKAIDSTSKERKSNCSAKQASQTPRIQILKQNIVEASQIHHSKGSGTTKAAWRPKTLVPKFSDINSVSAISEPKKEVQKTQQEYYIHLQNLSNNQKTTNKILQEILDNQKQLDLPKLHHIPDLLKHLKPAADEFATPISSNTIQLFQQRFQRKNFVPKVPSCMTITSQGTLKGLNMPALTPMNYMQNDGSTVNVNNIMKNINQDNSGSKDDKQMDNFGAYADLAIEITKQTKQNEQN